ncbi:hypothetical protein L9F63_018679 [Diploptera punctata]|uniref:Uncharacterized protein n=1 Tax=Diploptera punctata TaxID=6984 RepID=A0AAD7ZWD1_DIPPU|nr:hypothetical protein L9F63_018679 [Diploptera punctata]
MSEENSESALLQEHQRDQSTATSSSPMGTKEDKLTLATYIKQLLVEKQLIDDKQGLDLQLTNRLLANGKSCLYI